MSKEELLDKLAKAIIDGDEKVAVGVSQEILTAGIDPSEAISQGAIKGLDIVGERYNRLEVFLPELVLAGSARGNWGKLNGIHPSRVVPQP